jgi:hypothetical protein
MPPRVFCLLFCSSIFVLQEEKHSLHLSKTKVVVTFLLSHPYYYSTMLSCRLIFLLALTGASAFTTTLKGQETASRPSTALFDGDGTGGWGIGSSRKMTPEEFARGDRRAFDGYQMRERGDFMRQIKDDQDDLRKSEMAELLGVASIAGIRVKDPKDRLDKFEPEVFDDEEDDLDLSV